MRKILLIIVAAGFLPATAFAQTTPDPETLASIRSDLQALNAQIQGLRNELLTKQPAETGVFNPEPALDRLDTMDAEVRRLTGAVEELRFRIDAVVTDGTNRVGDLEFRLLELEGGDYATLTDPVPLGQTPAADPQSGTETVATDGDRPLTRPATGGEVASLDPQLNPAPQPEPQPQPQPQAQPTVAGFQDALGKYQTGDYAGATQSFDQFLNTNPAGPLAGEAYYWKGEALSAQGDWKSAARSYLESFSGAPQGDKAPEALYSLGVSLGKLGQQREACLTLTEVKNRFPVLDPDLELRTRSELSALSCL